ncbi:cysteine desulfurase family protein [Yunchengibacter salinarum]|uniref:cysteine desulfurase family protein n=1 Tax=Yunchengibacter salinarum TaxID=3133399 RepID=UPI0035B69D46
MAAYLQPMSNARGIYLDHNATAPVRPAVVDTMSETLRLVGNPSSVHQAGREARRRVEEARAQIAALTGARARDIVFTSGGTEANNAALRATGARRLFVSEVEHDSVLAAARASALEVIPVPAPNGMVTPDALAALLGADASDALVSIQMANNETGTVQDIAALVAVTHAAGARFHTDAVQAAGKLALDVNALGADYLTLSAHKIGGPQGVGALIVGPTAPLSALVAGGGQELGRRSGTENVAGIAGFGVAAVEALAGLSDFAALAAVRDHMEAAILAHAPDARIVGRDTPRLANTSCIVMPGVKGETQVMHFDLNGLYVSSGSACSSGKVKVSHVLSALGLSAEAAASSVRISLGHGSEQAHADTLVASWKALYDRTHGKARGA